MPKKTVYPLISLPVLVKPHYGEVTIFVLFRVCWLKYLKFSDKWGPQSQNSIRSPFHVQAQSWELNVYDLVSSIFYIDFEYSPKI